MQKPRRQKKAREAVKKTHRQNKSPRKTQKDSFEKKLDEFKVIGSLNLQKHFRGSIYAATISVSFFIFLGLFSPNDIEVLYISGGLALVLSLLIMDELFRFFPKTLLLLLQRGILRQPKNQNENIIKFLDETKKDVESQANILFGFACLGLIGWIIWLFDNIWLVEILNYAKTIPVSLSLALVARGAFLYIGFIGGMAIWRVFVIARRISVLGNFFDIHLKVNHPDKCGGLSPIGDLCQLLAYCMMPLLVLIGTWLIFVNILDTNYLRMLPINISSFVGTLKILIAPLISLESV